MGIEEIKRKIVFQTVLIAKEKDEGNLISAVLFPEKTGGNA